MFHEPSEPQAQPEKKRFHDQTFEYKRAYYVDFFSKIKTEYSDEIPAMKIPSKGQKEFLKYKCRKSVWDYIRFEFAYMKQIKFWSESLQRISDEFSAYGVEHEIFRPVTLKVSIEDRQTLILEPQVAKLNEVLDQLVVLFQHMSEQDVSDNRRPE